jgi:uncharacterized protein YqfA (UPF0365 family)
MRAMKPYSEDLRLRIVQAVVKREIEALLDLDQLSEDRKQSAEERAEILGGVKELYARAQRHNGKVEEAHEVVPVWVIENLRLETDATIGSMLGRLPTKLNTHQKARLHKEIRRRLAIRL